MLFSSVLCGDSAGLVYHTLLVFPVHCPEQDIGLFREGIQLRRASVMVPQAAASQ